MAKPGRKPAIVPKCGNCGEQTLVQTGSAWGTVRIFYDRNGRVLETQTDKLNFRKSTVLRCAGCGVVRKDVQPETQLTRQ